jgi:hypothetical protein
MFPLFIFQLSRFPKESASSNDPFGMVCENVVIETKNKISVNIFFTG